MLTDSLDIFVLAERFTAHRTALMGDGNNFKGDIIQLIQLAGAHKAESVSKRGAVDLCMALMQIHQLFHHSGGHHGVFFTAVDQQLRAAHGKLHIQLGFNHGKIAPVGAKKRKICVHTGQFDAYSRVHRQRGMPPITAFVQRRYPSAIHRWRLRPMIHLLSYNNLPICQ